MKHRVRHAFDQAAPSYDAAADVQREIADHLAQSLAQVGAHRPPQRMLDAGCGTGYGARWLSTQWPDAALLLVDFAPQMLMAARTQWPAAHTICADIEALPIAASTIDLYWSSLTWQWNHPVRCLQEAARVLTPDGCLAVATLGAQNFWEVRESFRAVDDRDHVLTLPTAEALRAACQADWRIHAWQQQSVRRYFPDVRTLLRSIKAVGAHRLPQRATPLHRTAWRTITAHYESLREPAGLPLTYDAIWFVATKR